MEQRRRPIVIDPTSKTSRVDQVYGWVSSQLSATERPKRLPMNVVRTALSRKDRVRLLQMVNHKLGEQYGFTAQWSGNRKGRLGLRLVWHSG